MDERPTGWRVEHVAADVMQPLDEPLGGASYEDTLPFNRLDVEVGRA